MIETKPFKKPTKVQCLLLDTDNLLRIAAWKRNGLTEEAIAEKLGISLKSFCRAKKDPIVKDDLMAALNNSKELADFTVENSLYKRANGYDYEEVKETYDGHGNLIKREVQTKHVAPDTGAQVFWLKNRCPDVWQDKRTVDNTIALERLDEVLAQIEGCE